jgi:hypothetical protein
MKEVGSKLDVYHQLALHTKHNYFKRDLYYDNKLNKVRVIRNSSMVGGSIMPNIFNFRLIKKEKQVDPPDEIMRILGETDISDFKLHPLLSPTVVKEFNENRNLLESRYKSIQDIKDIQKLDVLGTHKDLFEKKWKIIKKNIGNLEKKIKSAKLLKKMFNNVGELDKLYKTLESKPSDVDDSLFRRQVFYMRKNLKYYKNEDQLLKAYRFAKEFDKVPRHKLIKRMAVVQKLMSAFKTTGTVDMDLFKLMFDSANYLELLDNFDDDDGNINSLFRYFYILRPYKSLDDIKTKLELSSKLNETKMTTRLEDLGFYLENGMGESEIHVVKMGISIFNTSTKELKGYSEFDITNDSGESQVVISPKKDDKNYTFLNIKDTIGEMYKNFVPTTEQALNHTVKVRFYFKLSPNDYEKTTVNSMEVRSLSYHADHRNFVFQLNIKYPQIYYIKLE